MKIVSWNVNGIRAVIKKGFLDFMNNENPDIICLQEIKANKEQVELVLENYPYEFWNSAERKGYSGTAIFSKIKPLNVIYNLQLDKKENDKRINEELKSVNKEGRVITLEFVDYFLVTVYTPNSKPALERVKLREEQWDQLFLEHCKNLETKNNKPVIFCGDLNVAHKEIDLKNPQSNKTTKTRPGNAGFTDQERRGFDKIIEKGFVDTFRYFYPDKEGAYSWWSYRFSARAKNIGWRIDYFLISKSLLPKLKSASILSQVLGSDHCPIAIELK